MDANERIYVKHYAAYTTEDVFDQGEVGKTCCAWTSSNNPVDGRFDTIEDALKAVCKANCFDWIPANWLNWAYDFPDEAGRFDLSVMVDADNAEEATPSEIEAWKAGRKRLWACQVTVHLGVCEVSDRTGAMLGGLSGVVTIVCGTAGCIAFCARKED